MNHFFTADLHLGHEERLKFDATPFSSIEEHDSALINNWNEVVGQDDIIYFLGDFAFYTQKELRNVITKLNGNIVWIKGNHDDKLVSVMRRLGMPEIPPARQAYIKGKLVTMSHHPMMTWDKMGRGGLHLHGHTHSTECCDAQFRINVSVTAHNYKPVSFEKLLSIYDEAVLSRRCLWPRGNHAVAWLKGEQTEKMEVVSPLKANDPFYQNTGYLVEYCSRSRYPRPDFTTRPHYRYPLPELTTALLSILEVCRGVEVGSIEEKVLEELRPKIELEWSTTLPHIQHSFCTFLSHNEHPRVVSRFIKMMGLLLGEYELRILRKVRVVNESSQ